MISSVQDLDGRTPVTGHWRRALEMFDDYDGGGVLSEQLADDLVNDLVGLRARPGARPRRGPSTGSRPGPQPSRPAVAPTSAPYAPRPRLTLVRGGA